MDGSLDSHEHDPEIDDRPDETARNNGISKAVRSCITAAIVIAYILVPVNVVSDIVVSIE